MHQFIIKENVHLPLLMLNNIITIETNASKRCLLSTICKFGTRYTFNTTGKTTKKKL